MKRKIFYTLLILVLVVLPLYAPSPAVAKSEPQVLNFVGYTCVKNWGDWQLISLEGGGFKWHITGMINEPVVFLVTDKGREIYAIATKFLNLDITWDANGVLLSSIGSTYAFLRLVKGIGGWEGTSVIHFVPGENDNVSETGVLSGTGSLKGRVMTTIAYGGYTGELPTDGEQVCEGHGDYLDFGAMTGIIDAKKDK
jgi:hypothetical protein